MKTKRPLLIALRLARPLVHVLLILGCFYVMIGLRGHTDLIPGVQLRIPPIDMLETMMFAGIAAMVFLIIGAAWSMYGLFQPVQSYYRKFLSVWGLWIIVSSFIAFLGFGYVFVNGISRFVLFAGALFFLIVATLIDMVMTIVQSYIEQKHPYHILVVGHDEVLSQKIATMLSSYRVYEVDIRTGQYVEEVAARYDIVVVAGKIALPLLQDIADTARIQGQKCYHVGDELFLEDLIAHPQRLGPLMALAYSSSPLDGRWRVVKRVSDIVGSFIGLIILSPLLVLVALLIKLDSPGPVFYIQDRVGKNKRAFRFIKFRSMYTHLSIGDAYGGEHAEQLYDDLIHSEQNIRDEILPKIEDDPRVTRVGRFLRKTSMDELPSLISVLIGHMSLVGPRPHMPSEVDRYDRWQERLFSIKPGITGYAQIFGRDQLPFEEEARLDLYYIQNWSLFLDMYVLVSTVRVVFSGR